MNANRLRPTATWKLWALGIAGGIALAVLMTWSVPADPTVTTRTATEIGTWAIRGFIVGVGVLGGMAALRR